MCGNVVCISFNLILHNSVLFTLFYHLLKGVEPVNREEKEEEENVDNRFAEKKPFGGLISSTRWLLKQFFGRRTAAVKNIME